MVKSNKIYVKLWYTLLFLFCTLSAVQALQPYQFRREGFIYDERGGKVDGALLQLRIFFKDIQGKIDYKIYQTSSNDHGLYFFNIILDIAPEKIVATQIAWINYQQQFQNKYLRYSPGYNPFWEFTKEYLNHKNALPSIPVETVRDIRLLPMENPISSSTAEAVAVKYAPILVFAKDKEFLPSNIEKYFFYHSKEIYQVAKKNRAGAPPHQGSYLRLGDSSKHAKLKELSSPFLYYHIRPMATHYTGEQTGRLEDFQPDYYWYDNKNSKGYVLSYWFWYDSTSGPSYLGNQHQGGWQGYSVLLDPQFQPIRIATIGHNSILVDTHWDNINSVNGHPILYVAKGFWSDGSNVTIPNIPLNQKDLQAISIPVKTESSMINALGFAKDRFPLMKKGKFKVITPPQNWNLPGQLLASVALGADQNFLLDFSEHRALEWKKIVRWQEPGLVKSDEGKDPLQSEKTYYQGFHGRTGKDPFFHLQWLPLQFYGKSPTTPPFERSSANIFIREMPKEERYFSFYPGKHYGPFWRKR